MTCWILNSAVLTSWGDYSYVKITCEEARELLRSDVYLSAIGHAATAAVLSEQLGVHVQFNRIQISMEVGDKAIVFRIRDRLMENASLSHAELIALPSEFGILTRTN